MTNRIQELRREKKLTQLQLSIELGITQETVSAYENNRHLPSLTVLMQMSRIFGASLDYITGLSDIRQIAAETESPSGDAARKNHLLHCYRRLGSRNKEKLISYAEGLIDSERD